MSPTPAAIPAATRAAMTGELRAVLAPVVQAAGCDLEDVSVAAAGRRRQVRVIVDRDGGLTLDDVAEVSSAVSDALDQTDALGDTPYVLEVTSPGVERPLREPRHWRRATGRLVRVTVAGEGPVTARIAAADDDGIVLGIVDGARPASDRRLPYHALGPGAVQVEFGRHAPENPPEDAPESAAEHAGGPAVRS